MDPIRPKLRHTLLMWVAGGYLVVTISWGLLVPAWEANDELDHVANIEFILQQRRLYPLRFENWHETHQPPLYYLLGAVWQRILGIPSFTPSAPPRTTGSMTAPNLQLAYVHSAATPEQRACAVAVHKLRLLSTLLGLGTILLTYFVAFRIARDPEPAAAAAGFVGFLPKFTVISAAVSNDALVVMLCSLGLALAVHIHQTINDGRSDPKFSFALGAVGGAAMITKLNSLPLFCFLLASFLILPGVSLARRARDFGFALAGSSVSGGWWVARNFYAGNGWLGQKGAATWLNDKLPGLISRVPWTDQERFLNYVPSELFQSIWYRGGWNQFGLPFAINLLLSGLAIVCCFAALRAYLSGGNIIQKRDRNAWLLMGSCLMGLAAVYIIARTTTQGEGRVAYVGLSAFAVLAVLGGAEAFSSISRARINLILWPVILFAANIYAFARFVMPFSSR